MDFTDVVGEEQLIALVAESAVKIAWGSDVFATSDERSELFD